MGEEWASADGLLKQGNHFNVFIKEHQPVLLSVTDVIERLQGENESNRGGVGIC